MQPHDIAFAVAAYGLAGTMWDLPTEALPDELWHGVLNTVVTQRYPGLLLQAIEDAALPVTERQREQAEAAHETSMVVALHLDRHLLEVDAALKEAGIDHRVLKGAAHAALVYPDPALRSYGDIDLLIPTAQFAPALDVLEPLGYRRLWPEIRPGYDARFGKGATLAGDDGVELDLHRTFALGPFGLTVDLDTVFAHEAEFVIAGTTLAALDTDAMFLHACIHAALGDAPPRTVALRDVAQLLLHHVLDESAVMDLAVAWKAEAVVARAVQMAWEHLRLADVTRLSAWAASYRPSAADARRLATYVGENQSHTAKSLASLRVIPGLRAKAAFLRASLLPSRDFVRSRSSGRVAWVRRGLRSTGKGHR